MTYQKPASTIEKFDLSGRVAVVTGGSGLLGSEFCRALAEAGAAVVVADVDYRGAEATATALADAGLRSMPISVDITEQASVQVLVDSVEGEFGRLDVLVNSAALDPKFDPEARLKGMSPGRFEDFPLDQWNQALGVNLTGLFLVTQACVGPMLRAGGVGSIINICSTYGLNGPDQRIYLRPDQPATFKPVYYSVTKAGVLGFTRYLAAYYAGSAIRVNALTPGGVDNNHDEVFSSSYAAKTILGRMARRDEMNGALLFLASDASSYMTGGNLVVDGGWTAW